ncbi:response regulator [Waltera sp.]|uniref:response regulator n=1 Tax=Waltera sp. TaxID=2815806 RepID=UPI0039956CAA
MYQVIIVDDEPRILEGIIHLFPWNNFGFEVVASFTNGKEALEYINAHPQVDIVMTDIQMPVMTGIELSQKLKNEDIIVIFFSAYQDFEYARAAIINHVTDYLIKPMKYDAMPVSFSMSYLNLCILSSISSPLSNIAHYLQLLTGIISTHQNL